MSLLINIRHLEKHALALAGEAPVEDLDLQSNDELIRFSPPVRYKLEVQKLDRGILVQGALHVEVECDCVRCLQTFTKPVALNNWVVHLPLVGPEAVSVESDCVDLTPFLREDILLALPQHPLCSTDCQGLLREYDRRTGLPTGQGLSEPQASPWGDLDKLDL